VIALWLSRADSVPTLRDVGDRRDVEAGAPPTVWRDRDLVDEVILTHLGGAAARDDGLTLKRAAPVAQGQAAVLHTPIELTLLVKVIVLYLEQVGEVRRRLQAYDQLHRLFVMVDQGQLFVKAVAHRALPLHR
jgi:hypothetical protein